MAKFSQRHYVAIARIVNQCEHVTPPDMRSEIAVHLATLFEQDSKSFRRDIFMEACGIPGWKKAKQTIPKEFL